MLYLVMFNRPARQSLHDLLVGAVVAGRGGPSPSVAPVWKGHLAVVGTVCVAVSALPAVVTTILGGSADTGEMAAMQSIVQSLPPVRHADIFVLRETCLTCSDSPANEFVRVTVRLRRGPADVGILRQVADAAFRGHERFVGSRRVLIVLDHGFNLGFAAGHKQAIIWTTVAQWQAGRLAGVARTDARISAAGSPPGTANVLPIVPAQNKIRTADSSDAGDSRRDQAAVADEYRALLGQATTLVKAGKWAEAIVPASGALTAVEARLGPDHPDTGRILVYLAQLYRHEGKYAEAEPLHRRGLAIMEKAAGTDNDEIIRYRESLAFLEHIMRRDQDAESLLRKSLTSRETLSGPGNPDVCKSLDNLAILYQSQSRYDEAEAAIKRCLAARETVLGPDHPQVGQSLHQLARLYREHGRSADAIPIFERARAVLGPNHPEVVLAAIAAGDFDQAARSLAIRNPPGDSAALERAVRRNFFGQVTELRWASSRMNAGALLIDGVVMHGNGLWQPFTAQMAKANDEWKLASISLLGLAWK
jgi:tetratricopeptide (TPR) repeat protein